jgi:hypothetical protein
VKQSAEQKIGHDPGTRVAGNPTPMRINNNNNNNNNNSISYFVIWKGGHELFPGLNTGSSNYNKSL